MKLTDVVLLTPPARLWYLLYMRANLETIPKYRITFTRNNPSDDPAPDDLCLERRGDGGWHLLSESEAFAGIIIPAEAVEHLVAVMSALHVPKEEPPKVRIEPDPGYRIVPDGEPAAPGDLWKYPDGRTISATPGMSVQGSVDAAILQRREPDVNPDPGYRIVVPGERIQSGDLWKYPDGNRVPANITVGQKLESNNTSVLQRPDPDAVAPGHNPDRLTVAQVGIAEGWRLLTEKETEELRHKDVRPTAFWDPDDRKWSSHNDVWWVGPSETLRTKAEKLEVVS